MAITSLSLAPGASAHVTANVLDQYGNVMTGLQAVVTDPGPNTTFTPDAGITDAGTVQAGSTPGTDTLTATYGSLSSTLPVTVALPAPVPTAIQWTSP